MPPWPGPDGWAGVARARAPGSKLPVGAGRDRPGEASVRQSGAEVYVMVPSGAICRFLRGLAVVEVQEPTQALWHPTGAFSLAGVSGTAADSISRFPRPWWLRSA